MVGSILVVLITVITFNMSISLRKGRDATRKNDMSAVQKALDLYYQKYSVYPLSNDKGQIVGCFEDEVVTDKKTGLPLNAVECIWGVSKFENITSLVRDPDDQKGTSYLYISDGNSYRFLVSLEGKDEDEYNPSVILKNLQCGMKICNYERSSI